MKKFAFTLAEVLITLTVIGVVAAMVLPNLAKNYQNKTLETQTKHFYSMMTLAIQNYMADNKVDDLTDTPMYCAKFERYGTGCLRAKKELDNFVMRYLKVAQVCERVQDGHATSQNKCYRQEAKVIDKTSPNHSEYTPRYILMNGYAIYIEAPGTMDNDYPMKLLVDVNGQKGPNRGGRDIWDLWVHYDGTINEKVLTPECVSDESCMSRYRSGAYGGDCLTSYFGTGCFGRFKDNGFKFDY